MNIKFFFNNFEITYCLQGSIDWSWKGQAHFFLTFFLIAILLKTMKMECFQLTICILLYWTTNIIISECIFLSFFSWYKEKS